MRPLLPVDYINTSFSNMGGWQQRHREALRYPTTAEQPIINMLAGWVGYATAHASRYQSSIGDDGVLGPAWAEVGSAIRRLLNGDCGRLDCGTLDHIISENLTRCGFDPDTLGRLKN